jgi:hypothetical protein
MKTDYKAEEQVYICKAMMVLWVEAGFFNQQVISKAISILKDLYGLSPEQATSLMSRYQDLGNRNKKERRRLRETVEYLRENLLERIPRAGKFEQKP